MKRRMLELFELGEYFRRHRPMMEQYVNWILIELDSKQATVVEE